MTTIDVLKKIQPKTFIQIGGFDGKTNDPLYDFLIASDTIKGVILEPQPEIFPLLENNYRSKEHITLINAAIHWDNGVQEFFSLRKDVKFPKEVYQLSSFNKETIAAHSKYIKGLERYIISTDVKTLTLDHVLTFYNLNPLDLIQIDTEGFDYEIIKMMEKHMIWPKIIRFEAEHLNSLQLHYIQNLLESRHYKSFKEDLDIVAFKDN